jgi:hypothetical protein
MRLSLCLFEDDVFAQACIQMILSALCLKLSAKCYISVGWLLDIFRCKAVAIGFTYNLSFYWWPTHGLSLSSDFFLAMSKDYTPDLDVEVENERHRVLLRVYPDIVQGQFWKRVKVPISRTINLLPKWLTGLSMNFTTDNW